MHDEPKFEGLFDSSLEPESAIRINAESVKKQRDFNMSVTEVLLKEGSDPSEKLDGLRKIENNATDPSSPNLMKLFTSYRDLGAFGDMERLYENTTNDKFKNAPLVKEFLAVAHNKNGQAAKTLQVVESIRAAAADPAHPRPDLMNGEVYGAMAKAYVVQQGAAEALSQAIESGDTTNIEKNRAIYAKAFGLSEKASLPTVDQLKKQASDLALAVRDTYAEGFNVNFEYYPGINAVYGDLTLGNFEQAQNTAELVQLAAIRDGGFDRGNYWTSMTMLESSLIKGTNHEYIDSTLNKIIGGNDIPAWNLESTVGAWNSRVYPALEKLMNDPDPTKGNRAASILESFKYAEQKLAAGVAAKALTKAPASLKNQLEEKTHSYRGMSVFDAEVVKNNFDYGGIIAHTSVTRRDRYEIGKLLDMPADALMRTLGGNPNTLPAAARGGAKLGDIKDPEVFIETAQKIVRQNFGTAKKGLEIIGGADHKKFYDSVIESLNEISGIPKDRSVRSQYDSRTSLASEFAKGLGDCRHHAQAMQILYDTWQGKRLNEHIRAAQNANTPEGRAQAIKAFHKLESIQLRTLDIEVFAQIKRKETYVPERPDQDVGLIPKETAFIKSDEAGLPFFEEHTTNVLFYKDEKGNIEKARMADSFYNKTYKWRNQNIDFDEMKLDSEGRITFAGGDLKNVLGAAGLKVPVTSRPTPYSGNRGKTAADDIGDVWEKGLPISKFDMIDSLKQRLKIEEQLTKIKQFIHGADEAPAKIIKSQEIPSSDPMAGYKGCGWRRLAQRGAPLNLENDEKTMPYKKSTTTGRQRKSRHPSPM